MTRKRFSIPYFLSPDSDSLIECIPSCMGENEPAKYEPITQAEYNRMRASVQYWNTSYVAATEINKFLNNYLIANCLASEMKGSNNL